MMCVQVNLARIESFLDRFYTKKTGRWNEKNAECVLDNYLFLNLHPHSDKGIMEIEVVSRKTVTL